MHVSIKIIPIGVGTSLSTYVAKTVEIIENLGYKPIISPAETSFEIDSIEKLGYVLRKIHDTLYSMGVQRIVTIITVDDRRDKYVSLESKVRKIEILKKKVVKEIHGIM